MRAEGHDSHAPHEQLLQPKRQLSASVYGNDEEKNVGLITKSPSTDLHNEDDDSDLARAVVDILSCCTGSYTNQAKILQGMQSRYNEKGSLLEQGNSDWFEDECSQNENEKRFSPKQWIRNLQPKIEESLQTEEPYVREVQGKDTKKQRTKQLMYGLGCIVLILIVVIVVIVCKFGIKSVGSKTPKIFSGAGSVAPTTDCDLFATQERPNPLSQCGCDGSFTKLSPKTKEKYAELKKAFGENYLKNNETVDSCSSRNQALVWLADDGVNLESPSLVQRHSLALFFIKMNGLHWTLADNQKWMTPDHECTWFGVTCNENKDVVALELWNANLDGSIPKELLSLTMLRTLSLPENSIHGELPAETFKFMSKLTDLTLFMNSISGTLAPAIFDSVGALETLNLDSNDMTNAVPSEIGLLSNLKALKLARNYFQGTIPTEIGNLKTLEVVELEENNIVGTLPSEIGELQKLQTLDLSSNSLQGSIPWEFQNLRNLKHLFLKSNDFRGSLPDVMVVWGNMENLVLSLNEFSGSLPPGMDHMTSLQSLYLDGNNFNGTIPSGLGSCSALSDIKLEYNSFSGNVPTNIGQLKWLVSLSLEGNVLTGTMPDEVCKLKGETGTLQTLSATCTSVPPQSGRTQQLIVVHTSGFICSVPGCCTDCEVRP